MSDFSLSKEKTGAYFNIAGEVCFSVQTSDKTDAAGRKRICDAVRGAQAEFIRLYFTDHPQAEEILKEIDSRMADCKEGA